MNITANATEVIGPIAILILGLIGIIITIMAILMPVYVYLIYRQGIATQKALGCYTDGFNKVLATLYHIQQNTTPEPKQSVNKLPL